MRCPICDLWFVAGELSVRECEECGELACEECREAGDCCAEAMRVLRAPFRSPWPSRWYLDGLVRDALWRTRLAVAYTELASGRRSPEYANAEALRRAINGGR